MNKTTMRAGRMSGILIGALVFLLAVLIGGSIFAATRIINKSTAATHAQIDADISQGDTSRLEALKQYLAKNATGIAETKSLTANIGQYNQNSIVATINGYANKAGVSITSFTFGDGSTGTPATTSTTAANANTVNLQLGSPIKYQNFIVFLRLIEQGLMPAEVTSATVSGNSDTPGTVNVTQLTVQVTG